MKRFGRVLHKIPIRALRNLALIEIAAIFVYVIAGILAYYAQVYRALPISKLLSFQAAQMIFVFGAQTVILMLVFYRWLGKNIDRKQNTPDFNDLLVAQERKNLEFKSSLRWDLKENKVNHFLEKTVMKTITSFLNSEGGHLVIGVDDNKKVLGLANDMATLRKQNLDGFENHFNNVFNGMVGAEQRRYVNLTYVDTSAGPCCVVSVAPSSNPAYLQFDDNEEFYIRTGNSTMPLKISEASRYIKNRF